MTFSVGYIRPSMYATFEEALERAREVEMVPFDLAAGETAIRTGLQRCEGYYVQAARDELPEALHVTEAFLAEHPRLLVVASYGAGYDTIDVDACTRAGVAVVNQAGGNAPGVAEHALGMMLVLLKRIPEADHLTRRGEVGSRAALMGRELSGRTVGLVGLGHVGSHLVQLLRPFGCRVLATDPNLSVEECKARGAHKVEFDTLLAESEIVTVHCPLLNSTRGMFADAAFAAMQDGAIFVSTARGFIHDESALDRALESGHLAGAGLDVWAPEPPAAEHPLLERTNVLVSPHTAGVTHESRARVARMAAESFIDVANGRLPPRLVNAEVLPDFKARAKALTGAV